MEDAQELFDRIAPDVLNVLAAERFFEALDDLMCPPDPAQPRLSCDGTYVISTTLFTRFGFDADDVADIVRVLASRGGCCDCEILFNVAEESRLKSDYWKARAAGGARTRHLDADLSSRSSVHPG